jgi:hypothetical protein
VTRIIDTTHGEAEYVVGQVTEKYGKDLTSSTFTVGLGTSTTPPASWVTPGYTTVTGPKANVALLVNGSTAKGSDQWLWVRVVDNPETYNLKCARESITVL